jgi:hypothetical protein
MIWIRRRERRSRAVVALIEASVGTSRRSTHSLQVAWRRSSSHQVESPAAIDAPQVQHVVL